MARSRSRSRSRGRRRHSSSEDSDYDRRRRDSKKKRRRSRSRSRSVDSDRRKYKSSSSRHRTSGHSSSHSRSNSRSERRDRSRERRRERSRSRSPADKKCREKSDNKTKRGKDDKSSSKRDGERDIKKDKENKSNQSDKSLSLKEKVSKLSLAASANTAIDVISSDSMNYQPNFEQIAEIEAKGFEQRTFVSTSWKKDDSQSNEKGGVENANENPTNHDNAIFGKSSSQISLSAMATNGNGVNNHRFEDEIFGPSFGVDPELRNERWLDKLKFIRQKILRESK
eukprot:Seg1334.4 transcript_id=Seg1334.4/GoldUCD/mRNA.D3Y31 product="hypothetical protein" protein_id=Seg1334.4/GoldUCD/D3Y31